MYLFLVLYRFEIMEDKFGLLKLIICGQNKLMENYFCFCGLIIMLCSEIFRIIFSSCIKFDRLRLEFDLNWIKLEKIMNVSQREQIYKIFGNVLFIKDFDIFLFYIFLWNICGIFQYKKGWGNFLDNGDNSFVVCIERI